jgi:hypothetical protein
MATCEKCGDAFKPFWRFTDVQDKVCEKCLYGESGDKQRRVWTAMIKIIVGFFIIIITPSPGSLFIQVIAFFLVISGIIKLIEDVVMHGGISLHSSSK